MQIKRSARDVKWVKRNTSEESIFFLEALSRMSSTIWVVIWKFQCFRSSGTVNCIWAWTRDKKHVLIQQDRHDVFCLQSLTAIKAVYKIKNFQLIKHNARPFFKTSPLFSRLLPGIENYWANFKTFSRIQDSVWTLLILWIYGNFNSTYHEP